MGNEVNNKTKIKNAICIVLGFFALALFVIIRVNLSSAEDGFLSGEHGVALEENGMREVSGGCYVTIIDGNSSSYYEIGDLGYFGDSDLYRPHVASWDQECTPVDKTQYECNGGDIGTFYTTCKESCRVRIDDKEITNLAYGYGYGENLPNGIDQGSSNYTHLYREESGQCESVSAICSTAHQDLGQFYTTCPVVEQIQSCTTLDGETVENGETIEAYINNNPEDTSCDNAEVEFESKKVYNEQKFVCRNGDFYFDGKVDGSSSSDFDYSVAYNNIYANCNKGCFVSAPTNDDWHVDESYYLSNGSTSTAYPYNSSFGSVDKCVEDTLICDDGVIKGGSRDNPYDGESYYYGYGACVHNPTDLCGYSDYPFGVRRWINNLNGWVGAGAEKGDTVQGYAKINQICEEKEYICGEGGRWYLYDNGVQGVEVSDLYYYASNCEVSDGAEIQSTEADPCTLHDGTVITGDDSYITVYKKNAMPNSLGCDYIGKSPDWEGNSATVYCKNGKFYTSADTSTYYDDIYEAKGYGWSECATVKGESCYLSEDSTEVEDNKTITAYVKNLVSNGEDCSSDTLKCYDGTLEFSDGAKYHDTSNGGTISPNGYGFSGCTVAVPCTLHDGTSVKHGDSITAYKQNTVPYGSSCNGEYDVDVATVYCFNGKFYTSNDANYYEDIYESLGYGWSGCTVANPKDCELDGYILKNEETMIAYKKKVVESGAVCEGISRKCNGGTLNGDDTYQYASCKTSKTCGAGTIENGQYEKELVDVTWNPTLNGWNSTPLCTNFTCNTGYHKDGNVCVKDAVSSTSSGGGGGGKKTEKEKTEIDKVDQTVEKETENKVEEKAEEHNSAEEKVDTSKVEESKTQQNNTDSVVSNSETQSTVKGGGSNVQKYTEEQKEAYEFAYEKGITTMSTIQNADMNGKLTRKAMAKMLSQYAINVLGQEPDISKGVAKFKDVTDEMDKKYDNGITLAYQLGIMGQNMKDNKFRPDDEVTRAEFATALSRLLYGTSDAEYKSTPEYYVNHMNKLKEEGIITKDNPKMKELRGYVMVMLMRSSK